MGSLVNDMKFRMKQAGSGLFVWTFKLCTGAILGITFALAGEQASGYGNLGMIFVTLLVLGAFLKIAKKWSLTQLVVFNLVCVLLALLLRMYVLMAPDA